MTLVLNDILSELQRKDVITNNSVQFVLRLVALELYAISSAEDESKWYKNATNLSVIEPFDMNDVSQSLRVLLAYVILLITRPSEKWSFHTGVYNTRYFSMYIWYLRSDSKILSLLDKESYTKLQRDDTPICDGATLLEHEGRYRFPYPVGSEAFPHEHDSIMKYLRSEGVVTKDNESKISTLIVTSLTPGSDFKHILRSAGKLWVNTDNESLYKGILFYSILKTKIVRGINKIFSVYKPSGC